ncbi:aminotransferase-like domain-containing protein [Citrobacter sedlakii]|uniref:aminotransferase-like domain-containing protein n=1 Tax=Citrobacter sedlakii TaxID=67826 RepID=UPI0020BD9B48|nr:PLP-dependent aminotransferase family protein [Citrobacter sedlakii]MCK8145587.1 PLP-dependent aminotransferase family protein [Citrobacter sedlakii]
MMKVDGEGVCIPEDAWQNRAPKLIYLTPAHQYPTGAVLSVSRRLSLITQAARKNAWLIEDDYDGDFRHSGGPIASMQGLTEDAPVFYIGSFSKTMFPSLKLGYVVFPANVMKQASTVLNEIMRSGQQLQQLALADFMKSGEFGRHLGRMRRLYRERQRILRQALTEHFSPEQVLGGKSGMHLTLLLAPGTDDKKIVSLARQHGLGVQAFSSYSVSNDAAAGLVIGYGNSPAEVIPEAVSVLAALSRQERRF